MVDLSPEQKAALQAEVAKHSGGMSRVIGDARANRQDPEVAAVRHIGRAITHAPEAAVDFLPDIGAAVGASIGGLVGTGLGGPAGTIPGVMGGAGLGGAGGKYLQSRIKREPLSVGQPFDPESRAGKFVAGHQTAAALGKEAGKQMMFEGAAGATIRGASRAAEALPEGSMGQKAARFIAGPNKRLGPELVAANDEMRANATKLFDTFVARGMSRRDAKRLTKGFFFPAEVTANQIVDTLSALPEGTILLGGGHVRKIRELREKLIKSTADSYVKGIAEFGSPDEVAADMAERARKVIRWNKAETGLLHGDVERTLGWNNTVKTSGIKQSVSDYAAAVKELGPKAGLDPQGLATLIRKAEALPDDISFHAAKRWRSDLRTFLGRLPTEGKEDVVAASNALKESATTAMSNTLKEYDTVNGTTLAKDWADAREATRHLKSEIDFPVLRSALKKFKGDTKLGTKFLDELTADQDPQTLIRLRDMLGKDSEEWSTVKAWKLGHLMSRNTSPAGEINGARLLEELTSKYPGAYGESTSRALLGDGLYGQIKNFATAVKTIQAKPQVASRVGIHILETGLAFGLPMAAAGATYAAHENEGAGSAASKVGFGSAIGLTVGFQALSRLFVTNPKVAEVFLKAMRVPMGRRELLKAAAQATAAGVTGIALRVPQYLADPVLGQDRAEMAKIRNTADAAGIPIEVGQMPQGKPRRLKAAQ